MANPKGEVILINNQEVRLIPLGYCACTCGGKTRPAPQTFSKRNWIKGRPLKFITGHNTKIPGFNKNTNYRRNSNHPSWKGGRYKDAYGYIWIYCADNPRSCYGYIREHVLICEKALGKPLPSKAIPHHVNGIKNDNRNTNLVLCQDQAYHSLIHRRTRAFRACGHAKWIKCPYCQQWDDPGNMYIRKDGKSGWHGSCRKSSKLRQEGVFE